MRALLALLLALLILPAVPAHADVNDFTFDSLEVQYTLGRDAEGHSTLHTREHFVARFPDFDQNRGFIRDLTRVFDGHDTQVEVLSVTDEHGTPRPYWTEPYGSDYLSVVMAVPEGEYVRGEQHYIIEYTQRDVTSLYSDTGADEFYWDINGTEWAQPFGTISARVTLGAGLSERLDGNAACYQGQFGDTFACEIVAEGDTFTVSAHDVEPGENVTVAIGFAEGTFVEAPAIEEPVTRPPGEFPQWPGTHEVPWLARVPLLLWGSIAAVGMSIVAGVTSLVRGRSPKTGRAIIAQYDPPPGLSVAVAAELLQVPKKAMTATLLDFAVRRKLRLLHDLPTDLYGAQALTTEGLNEIEQRTFARVFTGGPGSPGTPIERGIAYWFKKNETRLGDAAAKLRQEAKETAEAAGFTKSSARRQNWWVIAPLVVAVILVFAHGYLARTNPLSLFLVVIAFWSFFAIRWLAKLLGTLTRRRVRLTEQGALVLDHLKGLREFIRLAEADRIRMLQSASGAEVDAQRVVQVYERLLPYAVLFGFEKEWQAELSRYYHETTPEWAWGDASFTRALQISVFNDLVTQAPTRASAASSSSGFFDGFGSGGSFSSSSGGSTGGGFSGGGGGGGGGRGI